MAVSEDNPQNRLAWAETRGELVRVGDRIVVQAIPFQSERALGMFGVVVGPDGIQSRQREWQRKSATECDQHARQFGEARTE